MTHRFGRCLSIVIMVAASATPAAQTGSAIVGSVTDESGASMPGVLIEVASPSLIGGARTEFSGSDGRYRIANLVPGTYAVVFTLQGFQTFKREQLVLTSAFTATVDAVLKVGGIEESVTVTGESPVVDVRTSVSEAVITEELKEAIPSGRSMGALVGLAPGVVTAGTTGVDVAGSRALINTNIQVHGSRSDDTTWSFDGLDITSANGPGNPAGYYNDGLIQEAAVITKALPAEVAAGGVHVNYMHRSGGNQFHGLVFANGTTERLQGNNLTDDLRNLGVTAPTRIYNMFDVNPGFGGPILKDRLWFYASVRAQRVQLKLANQFNADGSQVIDRNQNKNLSFTVTSQINAANRLNFVYDSAWKVNSTSQTGVGQCVTFPSVVDITATTKQPTLPKIGSLKWLSVLGKAVTFETGVSVMYSNYNFEHGPMAGNEVTKIDLGLGRVWGSDSCETFASPSKKNGSFVMSYATSWHGSHDIRAGVQVQFGQFNQFQPPNGRGDWAWQYRNGVPVSVAVFNIPYSQENYWNEQGVFLQDSWTIRNRLTLNIGARFERLNGRIPAQTAPAGTWVPERQYPEIRNVPDWTTLVPRLAAVYDLTGRGKTALKVNVSRYAAKVGAPYLRSVNPSSRGNSTLPWNDDGDLVPQLNELGAGTPFSGGVQSRYADDIRRPYQWEYTASLQHELLPALGVTFSYFDREYFDLIGTKNVLVPPTAYAPITITDPLTGDPLTVYNQDPATLNLRDSVMDNYPEVDNRYRGFEVVVDKRFSRSITILAGYTVGANKGTVTTSDLNNPNLLINNDGYLGNDSTHVVNILATYKLPADWTLSGHWYRRTGYPLQRNYTVTRVQVPNLTQVNQAIQLVQRGELRNGPLSLLDMRLSKGFGFGPNVRLEPLLEVYNLLNNNSAVTQNQTVGSALGFITESVTARVAKLGIRVTF